MAESSCQVRMEVAEYVREIAHELAAMARSVGHDRLSYLLEMAVLEAADLHDREIPAECSAKGSPPGA